MFRVFNFNEWLSEGGTANLRSFSLSSAYERMCWVRACVHRIATSASTAPLIFYEGKVGQLPSFLEKDRITDKEHPAYKLFNPPNPPTLNSLKQLMYRTFIHVEIDGLVFWIIQRKRGVATTIDIKLKDDLQPIVEYKSADPTNTTLVGWQDSAGTKYLTQDVLAISDYNPKDELSGLSKLTSARLSLESEFSIAGWNSAFFKSGMKNPLLIQAKGQLTKEQKSEIKREILNYYSGIDGAHGALLMQGGVEVKPLVVNPKDIDFINGKKLNREEILAVFGVPPALVGVFEYANYSNVREQIRIFWEHTLLPKMNGILELIQFNILDRDFPGVYAKWDLSDVVGLAPDPVELATPAKTYMEMGYSASQVSRILNCPKLEPDKDFEKPEKNPVAVQPQAEPKKPPKDPNAGDPKPSDKPKPDNNNAFREQLKKRVELFIKNVPLNSGDSVVYKLWVDVVEDFVFSAFKDFDFVKFRALPQLFCSKPTEDMRKEFLSNSEKIVDLMVCSIYK